MIMKKILALSLLAMTTLNVMAQKLIVEKESINVGQVRYRSPITVEFKLTNKGSRPVQIEQVRTSCGCTTVVDDHHTIAGGKEYTLKATYDAATRGVVVEELKGYVGDFPYDLGDLKTDKNEIEFDDINRGERPSVKVHIYNNSDRTAEPQVMHLPNYLSAELSPSKIAPRHQGELLLTLDSRKLRDFGLSQTSVYLGFAPGDKVAADIELPVSAVLLPAFQNMTSDQLKLAPRLHLSAKELNLGTFGDKKKLRGTIELTNGGRTTLEIRNLQMFTTGLEVSLNKTKLEPGETAKLKIAGTREILKKQRPRVLMITNDPEQPKVVININAK